MDDAQRQESGAVSNRKRELITVPYYQHPSEYKALKGKEAPQPLQFVVSWSE